MMTGSLKKKKKKGGCSVIRACSLSRSNTVVSHFVTNFPVIVFSVGPSVNDIKCTES